MKQHIFIFILSLSLIMGSSFSIYRNFDFSSVPDCQDYLNMAKFNYKPTYPVRRYRPIVPTLAAFADKAIAPIFYKIWKDKDPNQDWSLRLSFFLINTLLMSLTAWLIWYFCYLNSKNVWLSMVAVLPFTSSIWCGYIIGAPMADSIYHVAVAMMYFGILFKKDKLLITSILFGSFAKESYIFFLPMILWFYHGNKLKLLLWMGLSAAMVIAVRLYIDAKIGVDQSESMNEDLSHFGSILFSLGKMTSVKGILDMFSVFGFFAIPIIYFFKDRGIKDKTLQLNLVFLAIIVFHMLLSSEISRMFYFYAAPLCLMFCVGLEKMQKMYFSKS